MYFFCILYFQDFGFVFFFVFCIFEILDSHFFLYFFLFFFRIFLKNKKHKKYTINTNKYTWYFCIFLVFFYCGQKYTLYFCIFFCFFSFFFRLLFVFLYFGHFVKKQHGKSTNVCCISFVLMILSLLWLYFFCNLGLYLFCIFFVFLMFSGFTVCCRHPTTQS